MYRKIIPRILIIQHEYYYDTKKRLIARSIIEAWTREPNRFLLRNYVKQWEEERERGRESSLFAALYVYWKIPEALFRSGKLVGEHLRQRLMRGMQFPQAEAARLSFDAPFPCTTPAPTRAFVLIRDREGGFEREFFGVEVRMLSWRKCAGNPIIYPERNRSLDLRYWFGRDSKDFLHPAENNRRGDKEGTTWIDRIETKRSPLNFSHLWEMAIFLRSLYDEYCWIIIKLRDEVSCVEREWRLAKLGGRNPARSLSEFDERGI